MAMRDSDVEELTKEKRRDAKKRAAKGKQSSGQRGLKKQCDCGSTFLITPGTVCGTCRVRVPEKLEAKGKQPCQGCGRESVCERGLRYLPLYVDKPGCRKGKHLH